ncbi:MAG: hypothetical protein ACTSRG_23975 [Candidatus Helarchaeota archaeon]
MEREYKLILEKNNKGIFLNEDEFLKIIKICENRNTSLFKKLVSDWEYLTGE